MARIHTTDRRQVEKRGGLRLSDRRSPGWLRMFLRDDGMLDRRRGERRSGFDRRARTQPALDPLPYTPQWPHN